MSEKQKVLIVDDEPRNQRILIEILKDLFELKTVSNGEEALGILETYLPDLILLDIMMPGIDGYEVCKKVRLNSKNHLTKIILVSGKAMVEERLQGYEVGADDYMTKPFVPEELLEKVKVFLRLSYTERRLEEMNTLLEDKVRERTNQLLSAEAKLINSVKMAALGEMAGGIAHEINTPLGTVAMLGDQIEELASTKNIDGKAIVGMTKIISETVQRIAAIIDGLRTFSRDGSQDRFNDVSVKQIIESTLVLCQERLKSANVQMEVTPISEKLMIRCRPVQISQVILNLINNACDAILPLENPWIKISAEKLVGNIQISITDSGTGIPEEVRSKLFQPFFTTKEVGKGTGLGLSISKGILDAHHGSLSIDEYSKNTKFILSFQDEACS